MLISFYLGESFKCAQFVSYYIVRSSVYSDNRDGFNYQVSYREICMQINYQKMFAFKTETS